MFMISAIIILLGGISVTRLPVDLLPDVTYPRVSVMVRYPGVGPQEIELADSHLQDRTYASSEEVMEALHHMHK